MLRGALAAAAILGTAFCSAVLASSYAGAQSLEAFYRGTGLQIVVGYGPGGGYDAYARILARHIGRHIPGQPNVVVQNMPGAGSMKGANYIYNLAPKDGSQIATFSRGLPMQPLLDPQGVQFDPLKFGWIGSVTDEVSVIFAWSTTGITTFEDLRKREMVVAASGTGADSAIFPYMMNAVLGTRFRVIMGYPDSNATMIAIERGEAEGSAATSWGSLSTTRKDWLDNKKVNVIGQMAMRKRDAFTAVPMVIDFASNELDRRTLELVFSRQLLAYPFTAPPGIPAERLQSLRSAFDATMKDPAFLVEAKRSSLDIDPVGGETIERLLKDLYASPRDVVARAQAAIADGVKRSSPGK